MTAALALAQLVTDSDLEHGSLYPALPRIRVSAAIAARGKASGFGYAWPPRRERHSSVRVVTDGEPQQLSTKAIRDLTAE